MAAVDYVKIHSYDEMSYMIKLEEGKCLYKVKELLGSGASGDVYRCVLRTDVISSSCSNSNSNSHPNNCSSSRNSSISVASPTTTSSFPHCAYSGGGDVNGVYDEDDDDDDDAHDNSTSSQRIFAVKILKQQHFVSAIKKKIGKSVDFGNFKIIMRKGTPLPVADSPISEKNIWWIKNEKEDMFVAALLYIDGKNNQIWKELSLKQCVSIWGLEPEPLRNATDISLFPSSKNRIETIAGSRKVVVPILPQNYWEFIIERNRKFREVNNMKKINDHPHIIRLERVLEQIEDYYSRLYIVMELVSGGTLFEMIDQSSLASSALVSYFYDILTGVQYCHHHGICHRDLKLENVLLQDVSGDNSEFCVKIGDFGNSFSDSHSNVVGIDVVINGLGNTPTTDNSNNSISGYRSNSNNNGLCDGNNYAFQNMQGRELTTLKSMVGTPSYVAPEVTQDASRKKGYSGSAADMWSLGVMMYSMLISEKPFNYNIGADLNNDPKYKKYVEWVLSLQRSGKELWDERLYDCSDGQFYPFPKHLPSDCPAVGLIVSMLHPKPEMRVTVSEAMDHPIFACARNRKQNSNLESSSTSVVGRIGYIDQSPNVRSTLLAPAVDDSMSSPLRLLHDRFPYTSLSESPDYASRLTSSDSMQTAHRLSSDKRLEIDCSRLVTPASDISEPLSPISLASSGKVFSLPSAKFETDDIVSSEISSAAGGGLNKPCTISDTRNVGSRQYNIINNNNNNNKNIDNISNNENDSIGLAALPGPRPPKVKNLNIPSLSDFITAGTGIDDGEASPCEAMSPVSPIRFASSSSDSKYHPNTRSSSDSAKSPRSFVEIVKRSTRFVTAVHADQVLMQIHTFLSGISMKKMETPIGIIDKLELNADRFNLEVFGICNGGFKVSLCLINIFSTTYDSQISLFGLERSPSSTSSASDLINEHELYIVEFVRNQCDILKFKKFYQYIRNELSILVKKDYIKMCPSTSPSSLHNYN